MKKFATILVLLLFSYFKTNAQITLVITKDTTICLHQSIQLHGQIVNAPTTSINYNILSVPYEHDSFTSTTTFNLLDDDQTAPIPLPFRFCFYGNIYTHFIIASNGWVGFSNGQPNSWFGATVPNNSGNMPMNCIMAPFQDLNPHAGGTVGYSIYGKVPYRRLVVNYNQVPLYNYNSQTNCGVTFTGQIRLFETTNIIETQIESKPICSAWNSGAATHALHDSIGNRAVIVNGRNFSTWSASNEGYAFVPAGVSTEIINWYSNGTLIGNGNSISVTPSQTSTYAAIGYFGCGTTAKDTNSVTITVSNLQFANPPIKISPISCAGRSDGALQVNATGGLGGLKYLWNTIPIQNTASIFSLSTGNYAVVVKDTVGCLIQNTTVLNTPPILSVQTQNVNFPTCSYTKDGWINLATNGGTQPYQYVWSNGNTSSQINHLSNGNYSVKVSDAHQCTDSLSVQMITPAFGVNLGPDRSIGPTEYAPLRADVNMAGFYTYQWLPNYQLNNCNQPLVMANPHHTVNYKVIVTNNNGCTAEDSVTVKVKFDNNLVLINAFSPNGDGQNDEFSLRKYADIFHLKQMDIYNRWGIKVFSSNDINAGWDGTFNGKALDIDTYIFQAAILDYDGQEHLLKGNVSLIR